VICSNDKNQFILVGKNTGIDPAIPYQEAKKRSHTLCAGACLADVTCLSFTFTKDGGICRSYQGDYIADAVMVQGTSYYIKKNFCC